MRSYEDLTRPNPDALVAGLENLWKHCENMMSYGLPPIVAINRFPTDSEEEVGYLKDLCGDAGYEVEISNVWAEGGAGAIGLAHRVTEIIEKRSSRFHPIYPLEMSLKEKIETVARIIYGAEGVDYATGALSKLALLENLGFGNLPICTAKTQNSLSDNPALYGRPRGFRITVRDAKIAAGAGFVVVYTGNVLTMPGLPKVPAAARIGFDELGDVVGLS